MGFSKEELKGMRIAKEELFLSLENTCPDLYRDCLRDAKEGIGMPENWTGDYSEDKRYEIIAKNKIKDTLRSDLMFVKSVMGNNLAVYLGEEISDLLVILFHFRNEVTDALYRWENKSENNKIKSINAQVKTGKFLYKYEELYQNLIEITNKYREGRIIDREIERHACVGFYKDILSVNQACIKKICESYDWNYLLYALEQWCLCIKDAITVMRRIESENANLYYADAYFILIFESMSKVLYQIYQREIILENRKWNMNIFFHRVQEDVKVKCKYSFEKYDLIQNYGIHLLMYSYWEEREIFLSILQALQEELNTGQYKEYDREYDIQKLNKESLTIEEIRENFCEDTTERMGRFKVKYEVCKEVYRWYKEHHQQTFQGNEITILKAIYRECFIYGNIPPNISKKGMKSFFNDIKEKKFSEARNMSEIEMFVFRKIERGIKRERNMLDNYRRELEFMQEFHLFEKTITEKKNMQGHYLSDWTQILLNNIVWFLENNM